MSEQVPEAQPVEDTATPDWDDAKLSELFPDGALVTFVEGTEESSKHDDSAQDAVDRIRTHVNEEDGTLYFIFWSLNTGREFRVPVEGVEERDYGLFVVPAEKKMRKLMLSHKMSENQRQFIKTQRESDF